MKKRYFFISGISLILIAFSIYYLIQIGNGNFGNFNEQNESGEAIINKNSEEEIVTLGEFLKMVVSKNVKNVDYDLIKSEVKHTLAPYLKVAENYGVIENNSVTADMLDNPIMISEAKKICILCDVNMCHVGKKDDINDEVSGEVIEDDFLNKKEAENLLAHYKYI